MRMANRMKGMVSRAVLPVLALAAIGLGTAGLGVGQAGPVAGRTIVADAVPMGDGSIRSWVRLDADGYPAAVGVTFTEAALTNLPTDPGKGCCDGPRFDLSLPTNVPGLPFNHVMVNWNPQGHEPAGVYDKPHFDFHFYMQPVAEREAIKAEGADLERVTKPLPADETPEGYVMAPGGVPKMGAHWVRADAPELHGKPFDKTFLYGSYDGRQTFLEPMITKAYLESHPNELIPVSGPKKFTTPGYYPGAYLIKFDERTREYTVSLERMTRR